MPHVCLVFFTDKEKKPNYLLPLWNKSFICIGVDGLIHLLVKISGALCVAVMSTTVFARTWSATRLYAWVTVLATRLEGAQTCSICLDHFSRVLRLDCTTPARQDTKDLILKPHICTIPYLTALQNDLRFYMYTF